VIPQRTPALERAASIGLRTVHLACVVWLGAALLGAPLARTGAGVAAVGSGALLFAMELLARRMHVLDLAGFAVLVKLIAVALIAWWPAPEAAAPIAFWALLVLSSISSHAPKWLRHWRPGAR